VRYATVEQVQARVPTQLCQISAESQPSVAVVTEWLDAASLWLDSALRWRYGVPVTDAGDRALLAPICAAVVAARVWSVLGGHGGETPVNATELRREAFGLLAYDARTGRASLVLPNTALIDSGEAGLAQPEGTFTDPDMEGGHARLFSLGREF
jgi:hypothetical protein